MMRRILVALAAGLLAACLSGCSGSGVPADRARAASVQTVSEHNLSSLLTTKGWFAILHQRVVYTDAARVAMPAALQRAKGPARNIATQQGGPIEYHEEPIPGEPGGYHYWGTQSDGTTYDYLWHADGTGSGTNTRPDGRTMHTEWDAATWSDDGMELWVTMRETTWDGAHLDYVSHVSFRSDNTPQDWIGTARLADGRTMAFQFYRTFMGEDHLILAFPDGSKLDLRVPLTAVEGAAYWPIFSQGATGTFTGADGVVLQIKMTGAGERWDHLEFTAPDGTTGAFTLAEDFSGTGTISRNGQTTATLHWSNSFDGVLDLLSASTTPITPSAAARNFQIDRWISTIAAMGPAPMY